MAQTELQALLYFLRCCTKDQGIRLNQHAQHAQQSQHAQQAQQANQNPFLTLVVLQVKQQVQDFKGREARVAEAEQHALSYSSREAALTARQHSVAALEDKAQQANAAAEYARKEADAMWDKQKVIDHPTSARMSMGACVLQTSN